MCSKCVQELKVEKDGLGRKSNFGKSCWGKERQKEPIAKIYCQI